MSNAFGISEDDILVVVQQDGLHKVVNDADLESWMSALDFNAIENAALDYDEMDEQTTAAHESIRKQLQAMGIYDELKARASHQQMEATTLPAPPASASPRP